MLRSPYAVRAAALRRQSGTLRRQGTVGKIRSCRKSKESAVGSIGSLKNAANSSWRRDVRLQNPAAPRLLG
jgi:hypothetical protein